jgi:hypothetical protein
MGEEKMRFLFNSPNSTVLGFNLLIWQSLRSKFVPVQKNIYHVFKKIIFLVSFR